MIIIGHRGCKCNYPENTILSFKEALERGADKIELDILYKNSKIIVAHDNFSRNNLTLENVLDNFKCPMLWDIKGAFDEDYAQELVTLIHIFNLEETLHISSFNEEILFYIKGRLPFIKWGLITENIYNNTSFFRKI